MAFTFCTSEAIVRKAGSGADLTICASGAALTDWSDNAESFINCATRKNWTDAYGALNIDVKYVLSETASDLAAINIVGYNMVSYATRVDAEDLINVLWARSARNIEVLKEQPVITFMVGA